MTAMPFNSSNAEAGHNRRASSESITLDDSHAQKSEYGSQVKIVRHV
jgi:hypothetical protein